MATKIEEIRALVEQFSPDYQQRVLEYAQELAQIHQILDSLPISKLPPGTPGSALPDLNLPLEDAEAIERALEDCERIEMEVFL